MRQYIPDSNSEYDTEDADCISFARSSLSHNEDNISITSPSIPVAYREKSSSVPPEYTTNDRKVANDTDNSDLEEDNKIHLIHTKSNHINEPDIADASPYTRFGPRAKMFFVFQCAFTGFFSSIASAIYYPVLTVIEKKFNITEEQVNISVVVYFLFQGFSPSIMGGLADSLGRRPIILASIIVYFGACIGLARSENYAQIIVLRCLQAAGISPVIAINSGLVGDFTLKSERGNYVGIISGFQVLGGSFGALIGAALASRWSWRAIFWFLTIGSGAAGICSILLLPETKRSVVGNGSIPPKNMINTAPLLLLPIMRKKLHMDNPDYDTLEPKVKINFLATFTILKNVPVVMLLFVAGFQFSMYTLHQTSLSTALSKSYHYKVIDIGLCYLPSGICTLISVVSSGRFLNWYYRREMAKHKVWLKEQEENLMKENHTLKEARAILDNDSFYSFNLPRVRLAPAFFTLILSSAGFISFGWCIKVKAPLPAVLVTSGFGSLFSNCILTMSTTLIVDLYPSKASTGTGCLNLFRCFLSAIFIACLSRMTKSMTYGGVFTFMGGFSAVASLLLYILVGKGKQLTFERRKEEEQLIIDFQKQQLAMKQEKQEKLEV
ncbi:quinidine resistance protein 2 [Monosporozyma unispora]